MLNNKCFFFQDQYPASLSHILRNVDNLKLDTPISMLNEVETRLGLHAVDRIIFGLLRPSTDKQSSFVCLVADAVRRSICTFLKFLRSTSGFKYAPQKLCPH